MPPLTTVCSLLKSGVAAIFGPQSGQTSAHVQSICDALEVPHIENRWDFRLTRDAYSVNLYPHPSTLSKVRRFAVWRVNCVGKVKVASIVFPVHNSVHVTSNHHLFLEIC